MFGLVAALAAVGCGAGRDGLASRYYKIPLGRCLQRHLGPAWMPPRERPRVPAEVLDAARQRGEGHLEAFGGRSRHRWPAAVFVFFDGEEPAARYARAASERTRNVLVFYARPPAPAQRALVSACLAEALPAREPRAQ